MSRIVRSSRAKADVLSIGRYIAEQSGSRQTARRFMDRINDKVKFLARHPEAGEARPELGGAVRVFPVGNYVIFYRPVDDGIEVLRVLHGSRDIPRIFRTGEMAGGQIGVNLTAGVGQHAGYCVLAVYNAGKGHACFYQLKGHRQGRHTDEPFAEPT